MRSFDSLLKSSLESRRGIAIHLAGGVVNLVVTAFDEDAVHGRNQASSAIVVRRDRIEAISAG
jgi:hypothetical protein